MVDLVFEEGRATIDLGDNRTLSIINADRNEFIRDAKTYSQSAILYGWAITDAVCEDDTYEACLITSDTGRCITECPDPSWQPHLIDDDGWVIYGNVSMAMIDDLIAKTVDTQATD